MSREFTAASNESLYVDSCPITAYPFTLAAWCYSATDANQSILFVGDKDSTSEFSSLLLRSTANGHVTAAFQHGYGGTFVRAESSTQWSASTWHHVCGVFTNDTSRAVFLDGGSKGDETSTTTGSVANHDRTAVGRNMDKFSEDLEFDGSIAEAAIWNVALSDAEAAVLGAGYSPLCVRPGNLVFYCPLIRDDDEDLVGGLSMTADNTPTIATHPRIIYPARPQIITAPTAGTTHYSRPGLSAGLSQMTGGFA